MENIDQAAGMELNEVNVERTRQNIKGEAYALRAYSHFYLVNLYAKPYDPETCATDPGIPLNLSTAAEDKAYTRNSVKEVYDLIVEDLKEG
ncbi:MAG: RagB/SusD family nutrient uptake outer membrane protein, partial [Odoribacter splanchnicus]